jgi:hypothetical protein
MSGEAPLIRRINGGDKLVVASGGILDIESGGALQVGAVDVTTALGTASAAASAEVVTALNVITASESGKTFFLNHATGFVSTLPAVALGLRFTFILKIAVTTTGGHTIVCPAAAALFKGHVLTSQDAGGSADSGLTGEATVTFVINKAVEGDRVDVICDGVNWFVRASSKVFDAITIS